MTEYTNIEIGDQLTPRSFETTIVQLFMYNAAVWNPHRIHFDLDYAKNEEGYAGIVNDGPLQGDWMTQIVVDWMGESARLKSFKYSNRQASYLGDRLQAVGTVVGKDDETRQVTLSLAIRNANGDDIAPAEAIVEFS